MVSKKSEMHGILLVHKPEGPTSFDVVAKVRKHFRERCVGHAGTLDPFATGLLVILIGRSATKLSDCFLNHDKDYEATIRLGSATDSYDKTGQVTHTSPLIPTLEHIQAALPQGTIEQTPPMFSAKKVNGQRLYTLARAGKEIERKSCRVTVLVRILSYEYPHLKVAISCSKGTYVRSIAHDLGLTLGCYAHLEALQRTRSGPFSLTAAIDGQPLFNEGVTVEDFSLEKIGGWDMLVCKGNPG